jgi:hypothetical protein
MAEGWGSTIGNAALDMLDSYRWIQLHTGSPGGSGTGNVAATTTRIQTTWLAAAGGVKLSSVDTVWTVGANPRHGGTAFLCWSAWTLAVGWGVRRVRHHLRATRLGRAWADPARRPAGCFRWRSPPDLNLLRLGGRGTYGHPSTR